MSSPTLVTTPAAGSSSALMKLRFLSVLLILILLPFYSFLKPAKKSTEYLEQGEFAHLVEGTAPSVEQSDVKLKNLRQSIKYDGPEELIITGEMTCSQVRNFVISEFWNQLNPICWDIPSSSKSILDYQFFRDNMRKILQLYGPR